MIFLFYRMATHSRVGKRTGPGRERKGKCDNFSLTAHHPRQRVNAHSMIEDEPLSRIILYTNHAR